jgi:hypothetical protein
VIVRILGEGQFQVGEDAVSKLTALDSELDTAVQSGEDAAFRAVLDASVRLVREAGTPVPDDTFVTADFILPFADATLAEVQQLLADGKIDSVGLP